MSSETLQVRPATPADVDPLVALWHDVWHETHAPLMPPALVRLRTPDDFRDRLRTHLGDVRVAGPTAAPLGFCMLKGDELHQLFVSARARGSGAAVVLIADAEGRLVDRGVTTTWLACAVGNERAARFYEKRGWRRTGTTVSQVSTPAGPFPVDVWRYEKVLCHHAPAAEAKGRSR